MIRCDNGIRSNRESNIEFSENHLFPSRSATTKGLVMSCCIALDKRYLIFHMPAPLYWKSEENGFGGVNCTGV